MDYVWKVETWIVRCIEVGAWSRAESAVVDGGALIVGRSTANGLRCGTVGISGDRKVFDVLWIGHFGSGKDS